MDKKDFFEFGKVKKFNKKTAELVIRTNAENVEESINAPVVFIEIDGGLVPFYLSSAKLRDTNTLQILLEDYSTPEKARQFVDCQVFLPKKDDSELQSNEFYHDEIIGFEVIDKKHGSIGFLEEILDRPEQEILQINHQGKEILIPLVDEIIVKLKRRKKQLFIKAPEGLIDLYLEE